MTVDSAIVVVGGGIAGCSAALEARRRGAAVTLVTNGPLGRSNSIMAQGGIQLPARSQSDRELMVSDIVAVGHEVDEARVRTFVEDLGPIEDWLADIGLEFDRDDNGELLKRTAGGLSSPRIATVGDQIGRPLMKALMRRVREECEVVTGQTVQDIVPGDRFEATTESGTLRCDALVIATGGLSYQEAVDTGELTSNPPNDNASMRRILDSLGLKEVSPRRFQWHPFGIVASRKGSTVSCVPESVAALGPRLVTSGEGREVSSLPAPRSEVVERMRAAAQSGDSVVLTLSDLSDRDLEHFPQVRRYMSEYGAEPELTPVLHYELSGYPAGLDQSSSLPGLFLAGEIVGGVHGRERLMGAGVADSLVHGTRAGGSAAVYVKER